MQVKWTCKALVLAMSTVITAMLAQILTPWLSSKCLVVIYNSQRVFVVRKPKVKVLAVPIAYHFPARQIQKMLARRD